MESKQDVARLFGMGMLLCFIGMALMMLTLISCHVSAGVFMTSEYVSADVYYIIAASIFIVAAVSMAIMLIVGFIEQKKEEKECRTQKILKYTS